MQHYLDFEQPIAELEGKIRELRHLDDHGGVNIAEEISRLENKVTRQIKQVYRKLDPWRKVQVARHPERPHFQFYCSKLITDYQPLSGDRAFQDDQAILGGIGRFRGQPVVVIGHEKGHDITTRLTHNFGMARPEGYRKAIRLMQLAGRFHLPVIAFVDTPGAYPGIGAEERGQAEAIARSIETCLSLPVPLLSIITGEGGSGGAIALAAGDRVAMLEHSIYSVISPEGCASILWRDPDQAKVAAEAMQLTAQQLLKLGAIDQVIDEPPGGAHRTPDQAAELLGDWIAGSLAEFPSGILSQDDKKKLIAARQDKFLAIGRSLKA